MRGLTLLLHRWLGIALALYVVALGLSGAVLVYRNELNRHFQPQPRLVAERGALLSDAGLTLAAQRRYPGFVVIDIERGEVPRQAVRIQLVRDADSRLRLFDPYTGEDLGEVMPFGFRATRFLVDLHADLLLGYQGRPVNGGLSIGFLAVCVTGWIVWGLYPVKRRRPSERDLRRGLRTVHRLVGLWLGVFSLMWALTGAHLAFPSIASAIVDHFEPLTEETVDERVGDKVSYWLSYAHFGRFGGRLPGCERRSVCDATLKAVWAASAITPGVLAATGVATWALRRFRRRRAPGSPSIPEG